MGIYQLLRLFTKEVKMTIRKLTVAAAIAVGIATCSFSTAMAACPCDQRPVVTQGACPCENEMPEITGAACPCEVQPEPCGCDVAPKCEPDPVPSCALCPGVKELSRENMKQVYAYPNGIYGYNNYVGTKTDSVYSAEGFSINRDNSKLSAGTMGTTIASDGSVTGAAANIPCLNEMSNHNGIPIIRDEAKMDGNGCPIKMGTANSMQAIKKTLVPFDLSPFNDLTTGAAANLQMFPDVPNGYWASCEIDKLATNDVVVGYPDRMFKPSRNISRVLLRT